MKVLQKSQLNSTQLNYNDMTEAINRSASMATPLLALSVEAAPVYLAIGPVDVPEPYSLPVPLAFAEDDALAPAPLPLPLPFPLPFPFPFPLPLPLPLPLPFLSAALLVFAGTALPLPLYVTTLGVLLGL